MKKRILFCLWLITICFAVNAQTQNLQEFTVKGILLDSLTHEGEPYATISIVKDDLPGNPVKMAVTDMNGKFAESFKSSPGNYTINITSIGKQTVVKHFALNASSPVADLGSLNSVEATNELGAVEIVAQKPLVKADLDKITYNVEDDPDSQTNSVLEMLRKVPLVTVDGEDNIQVNGSSSFKVHINGKPNPMMSDNPTEVLRSLPANTIKNIEVITNPGAKYDAEGIGGILNIITIGGGFQGYTATITGGVNNSGENGSVYATIKKNKFTFSLNYNLSHTRPPKNHSGNIRQDVDSEGNITGEVVNETGIKNKGNFQYGNMEASYEIDTLRLLSVSAGVFGSNRHVNSNGDNWMADYTMYNDNLAYRYQNVTKSKNSWYNIRGSVDYQRVSAVNKDRYFTFSYQMSVRPSTEDGRNTYLYNDGEISEEWLNRLQLQNYRSDASQHNGEHTFQADYTTPFAKVNTLDVGLKYIFRNNTSDTKRYEAEGVDENYIYNADRSSHYKHKNDIFAAYLGYGLKLDKWMAKAGVRYEHTLQHVKFLVGQGENFTSNFNDVIPSGSIGYKISDMSNIRIGYDMRIYRPGIWYLNPYINNQNPNYITKGNPDLKNEKSNAFNLSYSNFTQKFNINLSLRYRFNNNGIESFTEMIKTGEVVPELNNMVADHDFLFQTYENVGKSKNAGFDAYVNWNASPKTRIYVNVNLGYSKFESKKQGLENSGWNVFTYGGIQHTFPLDIRATLNGMYGSPSINLQGKGGSFYNYSLSLNRSFLAEKRLTISMFCSNIFNRYTDFKSNVNGEGFVQRTNYKFPQRRFGLSVSYRLGSLRASVQKTNRSIENDDVKGGDGAGSAGGGE